MNTSQKAVKQFVHERGWEKLLPDQIAKSIVIEAAELLEVFHWGSPATSEIKNNPKKLSLVKGELADVLIYCLQMANILGLSVSEVIEEKLAFAAKKYPVELVRKRSADEPYDHERYLEIKNAYRDRKIKK